MENSTPDKTLESLQRKNKICKIFTAIGVIDMGLSILILLTFGGGLIGTIGVVLAFVILFGVGFFYQKVKDSLKAYTMDQSQDILKGVMDNLYVFDHKRNISKYYLNQDLGFPEYDSLGDCGDYVKGVLKGIPVEFCEFELRSKHEWKNSDDDTQTTYNTIFRGLMIACRHGLSLEDNVTLTQYSVFKDEKKTGDSELDSLFSASFSNAGDAEKALTPEYRRALVKLTREKGRRFAARFMHEGVLLLCIKDLNLFEAGNIVSSAELAVKMKKELEELAGFFEILSIPVKKPEAN